MKKLFTFLCFVILFSVTSSVAAGTYYHNGSGALDDTNSWYEDSGYSTPFGAVPQSADTGVIQPGVVVYQSGSVTVNYILSIDGTLVMNGGALFLDSGGTMNINSGALVQLDSGSITIGNASAYVNSGAQFISTAALILDAGANFTNYSTFDLNSGGSITVNSSAAFTTVGGGMTANAGSITVNSGGSLSFGSETVTISGSNTGTMGGANVNIDPAALLTVTSGGILVNEGSFTLNAVLTVAGGTFNLNGGAFNPTMTTVDITSGGTLNILSGALNLNSGTLNILTGATFSYTGHILNITGANTGNLSGNGTVNIDNDAIVTTRIGGTLHVDSGGVFTINGSYGNYGAWQLTSGGSVITSSNGSTTNYISTSYAITGDEDSLITPYVIGDQNMWASSNYNAVLSLGSSVWSATGLPTGLSIDSGTGEISGTPTNAGSGTIMVILTNSGVARQAVSYNFASAGDSTPPTITSISSNKTNGSYKAGEVIDIDVTFSEAVTSTGNVTVTLETGAIDRTCTFTVSNSTTGTCDYTVQAGDTSSDLNATVSGTIADQAANAMVSFTPGTSLATNKALVIDTTAPTVVWLDPVEGQVLTGNMFLLVDPADADPISGVQFKYGNTNIGAEVTSLQYERQWNLNTGPIADGAYTLNAVARDPAGNYSTTSINVIVNRVNPTISNVATSSLTSTGVTITWDTTGVPSDSLVEYGLSSSYTASSTYSATLVESHSRSLTGLTPETTYHYRVVSVDAEGGRTNGSDQTFTTPATPDTTGPSVSSVVASTSYATATITWTTNEAATSTLDYGLTTSYGTASSSAVSTTSHTIMLTGLAESTVYHFRISSWDAFGNLGTSTDGTFTTTAAPDVTAPVHTGSTGIGSTITLTYDSALDTGSVPATSTFAILVNGNAVNVTAVQVTGSTVVLTIDTTITHGQTIVLSYTVPGSNPIQDASSNDSLALSSVSVTNTTSAPSTGGGSGGWSAPTGGSGGGSGGGSSSYTPSVVINTNTINTNTTVATSTLAKIVVPLTNTTQVCTPYITSAVQIKLGARNNIEVVKKIQTYLNTYENAGLVVDGVYKQVDMLAVKAFQTKYRTQILSPWGYTLPTGIVFTTTIAKINATVCGENLGCPVFTQKTDLKSTHDEVPHVKNFLNQILGTNLNTNSKVMDLATVRAISAFQTRYKEFVLKPLGLPRATGLWYESTMKQANAFMGCPAI